MLYRHLWIGAFLLIGFATASKVPHQQHQTEVQNQTLKEDLSSQIQESGRANTQNAGELNDFVEKNCTFNCTLTPRCAR